jgi:hypothetical protein
MTALCTAYALNATKKREKKCILSRLKTIRVKKDIRRVERRKYLFSSWSYFSRRYSCPVGPVEEGHQKFVRCKVMQGRQETHSRVRARCIMSTDMSLSYARCRTCRSQICAPPINSMNPLEMTCLDRLKKKGKVAILVHSLASIQIPIRMQLIGMCPDIHRYIISQWTSGPHGAARLQGQIY